MVLVVAVFLSRQNPLLSNFRGQIAANANLHSSEYFKCTIQMGMPDRMANEFTYSDVNLLSSLLLLLQELMAFYRC